MGESAGIQLHSSGAYDVLFGGWIRRTDTPILDVAEVAESDRVLDVATGPGYLAMAAGARVGPSGEAVGVDLSPQMVARARLLASRQGSSARFVEAPAQRLPFADASFDVVLSRFAIHHMPGEVKGLAVAEMYRVLGPGGRVVIADFAAHKVNVFHHIISRLHGGPRQEHTDLADLLARAGFVEVESGAVGVVGYAKARKG